MKFTAMNENNTLKVILISAVFALVAFATVSLISDNGTQECKKQEQLTECKQSGSLPDIEIMRNAAARAKDIFSIVSNPIIR
jgi:Flp pilus assembly protein TadD